MIYLKLIIAVLLGGSIGFLHGYTAGRSVAAKWWSEEMERVLRKYEDWWRERVISASRNQVAMENFCSQVPQGKFEQN